MKIHSTALVDPAAQLGTDVAIGAFSVIGPDAKIGDASVIQSHVVIEGAVEIGEHSSIGHGSIIGGPPQDLSFNSATRSAVKIGKRNVVREHCTIHRGTAEGSTTEIGDDNFLMAGVHVGHNCRIGNGVIIANNCLLGGYVQIGDRAFIGGGTTFHQHTRVGRLAMLQGNSGFGKDIPPFLLGGKINTVFGINIVGLRRAGFSAIERNEVKRAFKLLYKSGLNVGQALARAAAEDVGALGREFFDFVANARKRGIVPCRRAAEIDD